MTEQEHKELLTMACDMATDVPFGGESDDVLYMRARCGYAFKDWLIANPPTPAVPVAKLRALVEEWSGQASRLMVDEHPTSVAIGVLTESHSEALAALLFKVEEGGE